MVDKMSNNEKLNELLKGKDTIKKLNELDKKIADKKLSGLSKEDLIQFIDILFLKAFDSNFIQANTLYSLIRVLQEQLVRKEYEEEMIQEQVNYW